MNPFNNPEKAKVNHRTEAMDYLKAGCELARNPGPIPFHALYFECKKRGQAVCYECAVTECTAYKQLLLGAPLRAHQMRQAKTNAQLAIELGISKRQLSKMRKRGEL